MLLERTGARVVLCATAGAADLLELRRQERASLYDLTRQHPAPLVPASWTVPVAERDDAGRGWRRRSAASAIAECATAVRAAAPEVVAISLLHSYRDDAHERALAAGLRGAGVDAGHRLLGGRAAGDSRVRAHGDDGGGGVSAAGRGAIPGST